MRQSLFILSLFVIFLFVLNRFTVDFDKKITASSFLKNDVLFYSSHKNLLHRIKDFNGSRLGLILNEIEFFKFALEFEVPEDTIKLFQKTEEKIILWSHEPFVKELLKKEISFVVFPFGNDSVKNVDDSFLDNTLVVARTAYFTDIKKILDKSPKLAGKYRQSEYGGHVLLRFPLEGNFEIALCKVKDLVLLSLSEKLIRRCLDVYDLDPEKRPDFATVSGFIKNSAKTSSSAYLNLNLFNDILNKYSHIQVGISSLRVVRLGEIIKGFNSLRWTELIKGSSITQKISLHYELAEIRPEYRELFSVKTENTSSFKRVSKDTVWYYWTNIFRIREIFRNFENKKKEQLDTPNSLSVENFASINGMKVEELLSLFKSEFLIAVKKRKENQFVPVPHIMAAIKIKDQVKIREIVRNILEYYKVPVTIRKSGGISISYWGGVISNKDIQPTYAIVDDYLLMASNGAQIREFNRLPKNDSGISRSEQFQKVSGGFSKKINSLNYIDLQEMLKLTKEVVNWGGAMVAILGSNTARRTKLIIDEFIDPVLDGLSMYSTMGITSRIENGKLTVESITLLDSKE